MTKKGKFKKLKNIYFRLLPQIIAFAVKNSFLRIYKFLTKNNFLLNGQIYSIANKSSVGKLFFIIHSYEEDNKSWYCEECLQRREVESKQIIRLVKWNGFGNSWINIIRKGGVLEGQLGETHHFVPSLDPNNGYLLVKEGG